MKDKELRQRVASLEHTLGMLYMKSPLDSWCHSLGNNSDIKTLRVQLDRLVVRFDELFDAVAKDLGYEAVQECAGHSVSPRTLVRTVPPPPEVVRQPTARCKKKGRGK